MKMKKIFASLMVMATIIVGSLLFATRALAVAAPTAYSPNQLTCTDQYGNVISYGASCSKGSGKCTSNPCP